MVSCCLAVLVYLDSCGILVLGIMVFGILMIRVCLVVVYWFGVFVSLLFCCLVWRRRFCLFCLILLLGVLACCLICLLW